MSDPSVEMLRHCLAALTYRVEKVCVNVPAAFGSFDAGQGVRKPVEILAHMGDVLLWGSGRITGAERQSHVPGSWEDELTRFGMVLQMFNRALAEWHNPESELALKLLQGPLADAMTHAGQLAMLSRMAGYPIAAESFFDAPIAALAVDEEGPI